MKKTKYVLALGSLLLIVPIVAKESLFNHNMEAATTSFTAPTFNKGDEVNIGNLSFTTLDSGEDIKLLANEPTSTSIDGLTWADAQTSLNDLTADFGVMGNFLLKDKTTQPKTTDLTPYTIPDTTHVEDGKMLDSSIPHFLSDKDWWLGDTPTNKRAFFGSADNKFNSPINRRQSAIADDESCTTEDVIEYGKKQSEDGNDEDVKKDLGQVTLYFSTSGFSHPGSPNFPNPYSVGLDAWKNNDCTGDMVALPGLLWSDSATPATTRASDGKVLQPGLGTWPQAVIGYYLSGLSEPKQNDTFLTVFKKDVCHDISGMISNSESKYNSVMRSPKYNEEDLFFTTKIVNITKQPRIITCPGQPQVAGTSSVRPYVSLPNTMVLLGNQSKRNYIEKNTMDSTLPSSDGTEFLTLEAPELTVSLTSGEEGVSGTTFTTFLKENNIVSIPVTLGGTPAGNAYVSAVANDKDENKVYGVLKPTSGSIGFVDIDITNLVRDPLISQPINLTLYQENSGSFNTSYMGQGTDITIQLLDSQGIAFDDGQADSITYGSDIVLTSHLTSATDNQADSDIVYSIITAEGETAKASISSQSYNATTGIATATIKTVSGSGSFKVAIDKEGNSSVSNAQQVVKEITLEKKKIDVTPVLPTKVYNIGDTMPTFTSTSEGLANSDSIPTTLIPILQPLTANDPATPDSGGKVQEIGKWKLVYEANILDDLTDFTDKYDVTLIDYDDDNKYLFETGITDIPAGWIVVKPAANSDGWNNQSVTIEPSKDAKDAGYTTIEVINASNRIEQTGEIITYSNETDKDGITPKIRLKRGTSSTNPKAIQQPIKIDLSKPVVSATIENEAVWVNTGKLITMDVSDTLSTIKTLSVELDGTAITPVKGNGNIYTFTANKNGSLLIKAKDFAGNETTLTKEITMIDTGAVELSAVPLVDPSDTSKQKIAITRDPSISGIKTFKVYYKNSSSDEYEEIEDLDQTEESFEYIAQMNGFYKFELVNNAGSSKTVEAEINGITLQKPVTKIEAVWNDDQSKKYTTNTWTSHDILLKLSNVNVAITDDVTWSASDDNGATWNKIVVAENGTYLVQTSTSLNKTYLFKAKSSLDVEETEAKKITVKIDKTLPQTPVIKDANKYVEDAWFSEDVTLETEALVSRPSGISQRVEYQVNGTGAWKEAIGGKYTVSGNGKYEVRFKTVDANGNESDVTSPAYVNISNEQPSIIIKLNRNPIKDLINNLTFGLIFKETIDVDIDVDFKSSETGKVFYIMEDAKDSSMPEDDDPRWKEGKKTSITPDAKVIIYAKAVSNSGIISKLSSINEIIADASLPVISGVEDKSVYKFYYVKRTITYSDALSGINEAKATLSKSGNSIPLTQGHQVGDAGEYIVSVYDKADNNTIVHFKLVPLPDIDTEIDGSDESKEIIDQIQKELDEERENLSPEEEKDYEDWIDEALDKWDDSRKKVVEDEEHTSKVEGMGDTTFDPKTVLIVDPISEDSLPTLPRKALYSFNVYLMKGNTEVQPNGDVKVYLPYTEEAAPIVYEIDDNNRVTDLEVEVEPGHVIFTTEKLLRYSISNEAQEENEDMKVPGPDGKDDTSDDVIAKPSDKEEPVRRPDGGINVPPGGNVVYPGDKVIETPDGGILHPDGSLTLPDGTEIDPEGNVKEPDDKVCVVGPDGKPGTADDVCGEDNGKDEPEKKPDGSVEVPPGGSIVFPGDKEVETPDGGIIHPDGSVTLPDGTELDPDGNIKEPDDKVCVVGPDGKPGTTDDICGEGNDKEEPEKKPDGSVEVPPGGSITFPDGDKIETPDGGIIHPDGSVTLPDGTEYDPDGNKKPKTCKIKDGILLNKDSDGDKLPDVNIDLDDDCVADLNVDTNQDGKPDVDIDSDGDGIADINIDTDADGTPDINMITIRKWTPNKDCEFEGFRYDTMSGLNPNINIDIDGDGTPDINVDDDGDGEADRNIDTDGDGVPDKNVDDDYFLKHPNSQGGSLDSANTGDGTKWWLWLLLILINTAVLGYNIYKKRHNKQIG